MLALLLTSILSLAFNVQPARAAGTIYIREDGSIDPPTALIHATTSDYKYYMFLDNIFEPIVVNRSSIVLDGAGCTLQVGKRESRGITLSSTVSNVTVTNTYITKCQYGIYLDSSSGNTLSGNHVVGTHQYGIEYGIYLYSSSGNDLSGNIVHANSYGIWLDSSSDNTLVNNNATGNTKEGIHAYSSSNNTLLQNNATGNTNHGIRLLYSDADNLTGNNAAGNVWDGIHLERSSDNVLSDNSASENNEDGFYLAYSNNNTLSGNNVTGNNQAGINSKNAHANNISNNTIARNKLWDGVRLESSENSTICTNNITANGQHGILIDTYSNGTVCENNIITKNLQCGVYLNSNISSVDGNNITANGQDGVYLQYGYYNTICGNDIIANGGHGVSLNTAGNNVIYGNNFTNNTNCGVYVYMQSDNNVICGNNIHNNAHGLGGYGVSFVSSNNNKLYHNDFMDNPPLVSLQNSMNTTWDDGYPSGGNYWSNYTGIDSDDDGIGDAPYSIYDSKDRYPLISTHYVAVNITHFKTVVGQGCILNINVTVQNRGTYEENINLTLLANSTLINQNVTNVTTMQPQVINFTWNTVGCKPYDNYTLTACVSGVSEGTNLPEHNCTIGYVEVTIVGDITGEHGSPDRTVDMRDISYVSRRFLCLQSDSLWDWRADINGDGKIDMKDISTVARHFQESYP